MAGDVVWLDVLPSLATFARDLATGTQAAAAEAGKKSGQAWSKDFSAGAGDGGTQAVTDSLKKASAAAERAVAAETQAIARARAAQRDAAAKVIEAEAKLSAARQSGDTSKVEAAELRLTAARDRLEGATGKVEHQEKLLSAAAGLRKDTARQLEEAERGVADATEKSGTEAGKTGTAMGRLKDSLKGSADSADSARGGLVKLVGGLAAATGAAALFSAGWAQAMETAQGTGKLQASLGLSGEEAAQAGKVAGQLYAQGYGESAGAMTAAVGTVISSIQGMRTATADELAETTRLAQGFATAFETDVSEAARNVSVLLKTGLAGSATEAFDLMTASMQKVPQALRGEVMDATQEYSQFFAQLGFDGPQALGLLASAAEGGQYQIDKTGDSLKEFTIRATDMSKTSGGAFEALGLNQAEMTRQILAGGDTAKGAFDKIVTGLLGMKDPAAQSQAALALFGTPLEDLGTDKIPEFLAGLQSTESSLGDVSGTASAAADAIGATADPVDVLGRAFTTVVAEGLQPFLGPAQEISAWARENPDQVRGVVAVLAVLAAGVAAVTAAQWLMNVALAANPLGIVILAVAGLAAGLVYAYNTSETFRNIVNGAFESIGEAGRWLWNNALAPMIRFILNGFADMASGVGDFLISLSNIPGFGWAGDAGRAMKGAADQARGLASSIRDIPSSKKITIGVHTVYTTSGVSSSGNTIYRTGNGATFEASGGVLNFAAGGVAPQVLPGYTPGRDVHTFWSPKLGRLSLSGGEGIMRPEWVAGVGGPRAVDQMNSVARTQGAEGVRRSVAFAGGGTAWAPRASSVAWASPAGQALGRVAPVGSLDGLTAAEIRLALEGMRLKVDLDDGEGWFEEHAERRERSQVRRDRSKKGVSL